MSEQSENNEFSIDDYKDKLDEFIKEATKAKVSVEEIVGAAESSLSAIEQNEEASVTVLEQASRAKESIEKLFEEASVLTKKLDPTNKEVEDLKQKLQEALEAKNSITALLQAAQEASQKIGQKEKVIVESLEKATHAKEGTAEILAEAESLKEKVIEANASLDNFEERLQQHAKNIGSADSNAAEMLERLKELHAQLEKSNKDAGDILAKATSAALGGAFKEEANLRAKSASTYFWIVTGALATISLIGLYLLVTHTGDFKFEEYIPRVLLMVPLTFIAIVANKQLSVNRQAREEYAHKSSLSVSFNGFRQLVKDSPELYNHFFTKTTEQLLKNPAEMLEKSENEIDTLGKITKLLEKVPDALKVLTNSSEKTLSRPL